MKQKAPEAIFLAAQKVVNKNSKITRTQLLLKLVEMEPAWAQFIFTRRCDPTLRKEDIKAVAAGKTLKARRGVYRKRLMRHELYGVNPYFATRLKNYLRDVLGVEIFSSRNFGYIGSENISSVDAAKWLHGRLNQVKKDAGLYTIASGRLRKSAKTDGQKSTCKQIDAYISKAVDVQLISKICASLRASFLHR